MSNLKFRRALRGGPPEPTDQREFNGVKMPEINNALTVLERALGSTHSTEEGRALHLLQQRFAAPKQVDPRPRVKRAPRRLTGDDNPTIIAATLQQRARTIRQAARRRINRGIHPGEELHQLRRMRDEVRSMERNRDTERLLRTILNCINLTENDIDKAGPLEVDSLVEVPTNEGPVEVNLDTGALREIEAEVVEDGFNIRIGNEIVTFVGYAALVARTLKAARDDYLDAMRLGSVASAAAALQAFHRAADMRANVSGDLLARRSLEALWGMYFTEMLSVRLQQP